VARGAWKGEDVIVKFGRYDFGSIEIDGTTYEHDVVIDDGRVRPRNK
jgi:hypothetical protein